MLYIVWGELLASYDAVRFVLSIFSNALRCTLPVLLTRSYRLSMTLPTAQDLMSTHVLAARADWTVQQLAAFFTEHGVSGAPVVTKDGALVGVVSLSDVAQHRSAASPSADTDEDTPPAFYQHSAAPLQVPPGMLDDLATREVTVRDIMMPTLFCVTADTPVDAIADKMLRGRLHRLLVVRPGSRRDVVGIVTTLDLLPVLRDLGHHDTAS